MKKRTSGNRAFRFVPVLSIAFLALASAAASAPQRGKKAQSSALIAGTVFRESGFSLPGAEVTVEAAPEASKSAKFKKIKIVCDARGEFAVRVPAGTMRYTVSVKASGYRPDRKEVAIQGEERAEVFFRLDPESK